jgi:hypothetical protein
MTRTRSDTAHSRRKDTTMTNEQQAANPTGSDLITHVLKHVRAREGTAAARKAAVEMLMGLTGILCIEFGEDKLSDLLANAEACAHVAVAEQVALAHPG